MIKPACFQLALKATAYIGSSVTVIKNTTSDVFEVLIQLIDLYIKMNDELKNRG